MIRPPVTGILPVLGMSCGDRANDIRRSGTYFASARATSRAATGTHCPTADAFGK